MSKVSGGNFIIMGVPGETVDEATAAIIRDVQPSGFILFARNMKSAEQVRALTDQLRTLVDHEPIICIDEEGGRVSRLRPILRVASPSASALRDCQDLSLIKRHGTLTARMLRMLGLNLNLAPVLDIELTPGAENSLRGRHYGVNAEQVAVNAEAFIKGMRRHGILCSGKHFPGYSAAQVDPHRAVPRLDRTQAELQSVEWVPFRRLMPLLDTIMSAHIQCENIGASDPASLSERVIRGVLRDSWRYQRCVITDDLDMGAVSSFYSVEEAAVKAIQADNDLVLICHSLDKIRSTALALEQLVSEKQRKRSLARIEKLRAKLAEPSEFSIRELLKYELAVLDLHDAMKKDI